jgi:cell division protein FtsI/penicillin-binding protein 2
MNRRLYFLKIIIFLLALLWAIYLFIVQIFDPFNLSYRRQIRYNPSKEISIPVRGNIYDRNGEMFASTIKFYQIDVDRNKVFNYSKKKKKNPAEVFDYISTVICKYSEEEKSKVLNKLLNKKSNTVLISNSIKESELLNITNELEKKNLSVIIPSFRSMQRIYSKGKLGARLLGLVKEIQDESDPKNRSVYRMEGFCGVEASFDEYLKGEYGWKETLYDANKSIVTYPDLQEKPAKDGNTVYLTIDSEIQQIVEDNLWEGIKKYNAANAMAVVMNPKTGEILAMAGLSRSDGNTSESLIRSSMNLPVTHRFEPGSTIKPFVSLLALDKKLFRTNDLINCARYNVGRRTIKDSHELGTISFEDIIVKSSNVGIAKVAERIGSVELYNRYIALGFGHKTGANIYGESAGNLKKYTDWSGYTLHSLSFGQEMTVNTLQLTNAYSTIANGGKVLRPYILKEVRDANNKLITKTEPKVIRTISNANNIKLEQQYLKNVVERGTATTTRLNYVSIGGKTGTAEKKAEGSAGYGKYTYSSVFSGFFPVEDPQYVMTVMFDEPDYAYHFGSMSSVPTFKKITEQIIALPTCKLIPNMKQGKQIMVKMPDVMGLSISEARSKLNKNNIKYQMIENDLNGIVINQFPKPDVSFDSVNEAIVVVDKKVNLSKQKIDTSQMPNLVGMTVRKAISLAKSLKIELEISGSGIITAQSIQPGEKIKFLQKCKVKAE